MTDSTRLTIAIISPGLFSVPPVIGTSVEHDIDMVSRELSKEHRVIVYTRKCKEYPHSTRKGKLTIRRIPYRGPRDYLKQVCRHLGKRKPDLIQVENRPHFVPYLRKKFPHTPLILNMHSMHFASKSQLPPERAKAAMKQVDGLLTNSQFLAREYLRKFPVLKGKVHGVHLGIDPQPYLKAREQKNKIKKWRKRFGLKSKDKVLLFAGRLNRNKGAHHLLRALPKIMEEVEQVKLLLVGSPRYGGVRPTRYLKKLKKQSEKWSKQIKFTGFIKPKYMPYIYQLADIVVTPSVWKEPFCRVNLEAMAAAKPVVTTDRGGIPEVVQHQKNGYVLSLKNIDASLPETLIHLLKNKDERKELGEQGLALAKQEFTWEKTAKEYLRVYQQIIQLNKETVSEKLAAQP